jgi:nucleotide-binding universal stress UspA family protein
MLRRILVAIDETPAGRVARDLAIAIAKQRGAALTGLGVVDRPWATAPRAVPIGGSAYKEHRDQVVLDELRQEVEALLGAFADVCDHAGVRFTTVEVEGTPAGAIESEAQGCDLIVIGRDTNFHFEAEPDMTETVARLIRENARPVLVTSAGEPTGDTPCTCSFCLAWRMTVKSIW